MHKRVVLARSHRDEHHQRTGSVAPAIRSNPLDPLRLPVVTAPAKFAGRRYGGQTELAGLALALLDQGFIKTDAQGAIQTLVAQGLEAVLQRELGELAIVERFDINVGLDSASAAGYLSSACDMGMSDGSLWIGLDSGNTGKECVIGTTVTSLDALIPGFGEAVLHTLESLSHRSISAWTPAHAREMGSYCLWYGAETHEDWIDEIEGLGGDPEDYECSPKEYEDSFGAPWITRPKKVKGITRMLRTAAASQDEKAREVAALLVTARRLLKKGGLIPSAHLLDAESAYRSALVRWDKDDWVPRIADEYIEQSNQCCDSFTSVFAAYEIEHADAQQCAKWLDEFRSGLAIYKLLDRLLVSLSCDTDQE